MAHHYWESPLDCCLSRAWPSVDSEHSADWENNNMRKGSKIMMLRAIQKSLKECQWIGQG